MLSFSLNESDARAKQMLVNLNFNLNVPVASEWASDIFIKAVKGKLQSDTNTLAYAQKCSLNQESAKIAREVNLLNGEEMEVYGSCGVSDSVLEFTENYLDDIIESEEIKKAVSEFIDMREYLYIEEGIDIWVMLEKLHKCLDQRKAFNKSLVDKFKYIMTEYHMEDILLTLAKNKKCYTILEGMIC